MARVLLFELLIKLKRRDVTLDVILQNPKAHRECVDFCVLYSDGTLRVVRASLLKYMHMSVHLCACVRALVVLMCALVGISSPLT